MDTSIDLSSQTASQPAQVRSVVVIGAGGHGRELGDIVRQISASDRTIDLLGIVDDGVPDRLALARGGFRFLGPSSAMEGRDLDVYIGIGDPAIRRAVDERTKNTGNPLQHPTAIVGSGVRLDPGAVLAQGVIVTTNVHIHRHAHINIGATISHDCIVGAYSTVCPGATLTGNVTLDEGVFIGAGATILPGVTVGAGSVIGAGATVVDDVGPLMTVKGTPAR